MVNVSGKQEIYLDSNVPGNLNPFPENFLNYQSQKYLNEMKTFSLL